MWPRLLKETVQVDVIFVTTTAVESKSTNTFGMQIYSYEISALQIRDHQHSLALIALNTTINLKVICERGR